MVSTMRTMKDSGTSFIGEIPENWKINKIKHHIERFELRNPGEQQILSVYREYGVVPKDSRDDNHNVTSEDTSKYKYVKPGYFVINKMKAWQGSMGVSDYEGVVSPAYYIYHFIDESINKKYFHYLLRYCYKEEFRRLSGGIREGQWDLPSNEFENALVITPDLLEQQAIVTFLDSKCTEIDALSADIQSEIDTLDAYKRSVITETVTKGVEKDIPLKDSGMAWCKRIPVRWEVIPSKYLFANSDLRRLDGDEQLTASQRHGIITQTEYMERENAKIVFANQGLENWKHVSPNDFIISLRSFQGGLELSEVSGCITWHYVVLKAKKPVFHRYYKWLFKSSVYITALQRTCNFIRDGQDLRYSNFAQVPLPLPPIAEQKKIADYLDGKCRDIDDIIALKREQLTVLADYKKSVIYEYVTGKKEAPVI